MNHLNDFYDFIFEKSNLPTTYTYTKNQGLDKEHEAACRDKDDSSHEWKKDGDSKTGKASRVQKFKCKCGYKKTITNDEGKSLTIKYSKD